jgi:hypothetical protein
VRRFCALIDSRTARCRRRRCRALRSLAISPPYVRNALTGPFDEPVRVLAVAEDAQVLARTDVLLILELQDRRVVIVAVAHVGRINPLKATCGGTTANRRCRCRSGWACAKSGPCRRYCRRRSRPPYGVLHERLAAQSRSTESRTALDVAVHVEQLDVVLEPPSCAGCRSGSSRRCRDPTCARSRSSGRREIGRPLPS